MSIEKFWEITDEYWKSLDIGNQGNFVGAELSGTKGITTFYRTNWNTGQVSRTGSGTAQSSLYSIAGYMSSKAGTDVATEFANYQYDFPCIVNITTKALKDSGIVRSNYYYGLTYIDEHSTSSARVKYKTEISGTEFLANYGEWVLIESVGLYNDSSIPRSNVAVANRGSNRPFGLLDITYYNNRFFWNGSTHSKTSTYDTDYPKILYVDKFMFYLNYPSSYDIGFMKVIEELGGYVFGSASSNNYTTSHNGVGDTIILFPREKIKEVLNKTVGVNVPFVIDNPQAAMYGDKNRDFKDWIPPGTPENVTGGGEGDGDNIDDPTDSDNDEPSLSPMASGCDLWAVDGSELKLICDFMWSGHNKSIIDIVLSETDITRAWVDCFYVPFDLRLHDSAHVDLKTVTVAGYEMSDLQCFAIKNGYNKTFDFGTIDISEYYGSYLDYAPYTAITIYLPYIGFKPLDVNKVMGKTLSLQYKVDFSAGMCTAFLSYTNQGNKQIFAMYSGQMGVPVRITGLDESGAMRSAISFAANVAACGLATIPSLGATGAANVGGLLSSGAEFLNNVSFETGAGGTISVTDKTAEPLSIGTAGAENWLTAPQKAYIIIQRAQTNTPENYADINGWATCYCGTISEFTGFLKCANVTCNVGCTEDERNLIIANLVKGVYV